MNCRMWQMLILIIFHLKIKIMAFDHLQNCFYEKRFNTSLHGYNDFHHRWISDYDCFAHCLKNDSGKCRSFEYWHHNQHGLCIRSNTSLIDRPTAIGHSQFVDYYEINCQEYTQAILPSVMDCSSKEVHLIVILNDIHSDDVSLGDAHCKAYWSNETHAKFHADIDNCSLILTNDSVIGKLHWQIFSTQTNSIKIYERFFLCRHQSPRHSTSTISTSRHLFSEQRITSSYRISLEWTLHNQSYTCPNLCFISLYSFVNVTLGDLPLISSKFFIDSCDLIALPPYTHYLQSRRLISQGCSIDPTVIHIPKSSSPLSIFHFSFYLYHILKEPIPFEIQCRILQQDDEQTRFPLNYDCLSPSSSSSSMEHNHFAKNSNTKRDFSYTLFRSLAIHVTRQMPFDEYHPHRFSNPMVSIATVHYIECFHHAFFLLILYSI